MPDAQPKPTATPTTDDLRQALNGWDDRLDFDRWLAEHDAQVLRDAGQELADYQPDTPTPSFDRMVIDWLRARADRIAGGAT